MNNTKTIDNIIMAIDTLCNDKVFMGMKHKWRIVLINEAYESGMMDYDEYVMLSEIYRNDR